MVLAFHFPSLYLHIVMKNEMTYEQAKQKIARAEAARLSGADAAAVHDSTVFWLNNSRTAVAKRQREWNEEKARAAFEEQFTSYHGDSDGSVGVD